MILDTCVFLWLADDQEMLSPRTRQLVADNAGSLFISSISAFEIALKHRRGALRLPLSPADWIAEPLEHHGTTDIPLWIGALPRDRHRSRRSTETRPTGSSSQPRSRPASRS